MFSQLQSKQNFEKKGQKVIQMSEREGERERKKRERERGKERER
jgi:hypothetical protein